MLLGDSLTEAFDTDRYFPGKNVINRGISGDTAAHLAYRLDEITSRSPGKVFIMIGINDLFNGSEPETLVREVRDIMQNILQCCPDTMLFLQSILPVHEGSFLIIDDINLLIYRTNDLLKRECRELDITYLDLHSEFLDDTGQLESIYTFDGVHLTPRAYQLWARLISDKL